MLREMTRSCGNNEGCNKTARVSKKMQMRHCFISFYGLRCKNGPIHQLLKLTYTSVHTEASAYRGQHEHEHHSARRPLTGLLYLPRVIVKMENLAE
jgi:hypothetical protein